MNGVRRGTSTSAKSRALGGGDQLGRHPSWPSRAQAGAEAQADDPAAARRST